MNPQDTHQQQPARRACWVVVGVSVLAATLTGCGPKRVKLTRTTIVPGVQELPVSVRRVDVLPVVVGPVTEETPDASFAENIGVSPTFVESKIVEELLRRKRHEATVLRNLATDLPNYKELISALVSQGIVDPDLKHAIKQQASPPDAVLSAVIGVTPTEATGGIKAGEILTEIGKAVVGVQSRASSSKASLPSRAAVRARFLVHSPDGQLLAASSSHKTCSVGHVDRDISELVSEFVDQITYCEREYEYSLFYDPDAPLTESAARMLAGIGGAAFITPEDVRPAREILRTRLDQQPHDPYALYLMGTVHELLEELTKATEYYNKAIALCPEKGFNEALARVMRMEQRARMGEAERRRVMKGLDRARAEEEAEEQERYEGKDYDELRGE